MSEAQDTALHRPRVSRRGLWIVVLITLSLRLLFALVPPFADLLPRGYTRAADYVEAAQNLLAGKGIVRSKERMDRILRDWLARRARLPREIDAYPLGPQPQYEPLWEMRAVREFLGALGAGASLGLCFVIRATTAAPLVMVYGQLPGPRPDVRLSASADHAQALTHLWDEPTTGRR